MSPMSTLGVALDAWRATRSGPAAILARQGERLSSLVAFARVSSPFYAEKYAGLPEKISDLTMLPPATKPELMARFDDWVTDPALKRGEIESFVADPARAGEPYLGRYLICTTSGTTGVPAILVQDPDALAVYGALSIARSLPAWLTWGDFVRLIRDGYRTAAIWATHGHFLGISSARRSMLEKPTRASRMRILSVLTPLPELVRELNAFRPAMLNGYSTVLSLLADEKEAGRLDVDPALVIMASESLPREERARIGRVFGCPIGSQYGASEHVAIATECRHGWQHVNSDWAILEPVDDEYRPVPPGVPSSRALLTNLANRAQPIIRYELGDRITVKPDPCPCGSQLPAIRLEGRTDDILRFARRDGSIVAVAPLAIWSVVKEAPGVGVFQLTQTAPDWLEVSFAAKHLGDEGAIWPGLRERLGAYLASQGLADVAVERSTQPPSRDPRSGKLRQVRVCFRPRGLL